MWCSQTKSPDMDIDISVVDLQAVVFSASIMLLAYDIMLPGKKTDSRTSDLCAKVCDFWPLQCIAASVDEDAAKFGKGGIFAEVSSSAAPHDRLYRCCTKFTWHGARLYTSYPRYRP